jgi:uncharacterized membrane protein YidH (DUF202 family)
MSHPWFPSSQSFALVTSEVSLDLDAAFAANTSGAGITATAIIILSMFICAGIIYLSVGTASWLKVSWSLRLHRPQPSTFRRPRGFRPPLN